MAQDAGDASVEPTTHLVGRLTRQDFTCKLFLDIIPRSPDRTGYGCDEFPTFFGVEQGCSVYSRSTSAMSQGSRSDCLTSLGDSSLTRLG